MAITDPRALKFTNESVRPMAEKLRGLKAEIDALMVDWFGGTNSLIPNADDELLEDGREREGVSRLDGDDIVGFVTVVSTLQNTLGQAGFADRIAKPCVRPLKVD